FNFFSIVVCLIILYKQLLGEIPSNTLRLTNINIICYTLLLLIIIFETICEGCKFLIKNKRCNNPNKNFIECEIIGLQFLLVIIYFIYPSFFFWFNSVFLNFIFVGVYIIIDIFLPVIFLKRAVTNKDRKMCLYLHFIFKNFCLIGCFAVIIISYLLHELASVDVFILTPLILKFD
ncbi:hypothetical protein TUBRATIS_000520, partial [Tubulinosema ratisbonensis]